MSNPLVAVINGQVKTTSLIVAEKFEKNHKDVLRTIDGLIGNPSKIGSVEEFNRRNFALVDYLDAKGEKRPAYEITRDGFTLLAMGFTGNEALQWKISYIDAFNQMEAALRTPQPTPPQNPLASFAGQSFVLSFHKNGQPAELTHISPNSVVLDVSTMALMLSNEKLFPITTIAEMVTAGSKRLARHVALPAPSPSQQHPTASYYVMERIKAAGDAGISHRLLIQHCKPFRTLDKSQQNALIQSLVEQGLIRVGKTANKRGPHGTRYFVV